MSEIAPKVMNAQRMADINDYGPIGDEAELLAHIGALQRVVDAAVEWRKRKSLASEDYLFNVVSKYQKDLANAEG